MQPLQPKIIGNKKNTTIVEENSSYVDYLIKKNDLILKYNYFKNIKNVQLDVLR